MKTWALLAFCTSVLGVGCVSHSLGTYETIGGVYFDESNVDRIQPGVTTLEEVIEWFGEPIEVIEISESEVEFRYYAVRRRESVVRMLFSIKKTHVIEYEQKLTVWLAAGVVADFRYDENEIK